MSGYPQYPRDQKPGPTGGSHSRVNGMAIASLILGFLSLVMSCLTGIVGVILGIVALVQIHSSHGRYRGTGMASAGIVMSLIFSMVVPLAIFMPAFFAARASMKEARQNINSRSNMRELGNACLDFEVRNRHFPADLWVDGKPSLSWRVMLLPYLPGGQVLYDQFHLDEPWDSVHNLKLATQMPDVYRRSGVNVAADETVYMRPIGNGALFDGTETERVRFSDIPDGSSNTIMLVSVAAENAVVWTKPADFPFQPNQPTQGLFSGDRGETVLIVMADGSSEMVDQNVEERFWQTRFTRSGGEVH